MNEQIATLLSESENHLGAVQAQINVLESQAKLSQLKAMGGQADYDNYVGTLAESVGHDFVGQRDIYNNIPEMQGFTELDQPLTASDTKDGDFAPYWRNLQEVRRLQGLARYLSTAHDSGATLLDRLCDYAIHTGFSVDATTVKDTNAPTGLVEAVKRSVDEVLKDNGWDGEGEAEFLKSIHVNGEVCMRVSAYQGGVVFTQAMPEHIVEPQQDHLLMLHKFLYEQGHTLKGVEWKYGVASKIGHPQRVEGVMWSPDQNESDHWEFWPKNEIVTAKINVPHRTKRGLSDYYPIARLMQALFPLAPALAITGAIHASISLIETGESLDSVGISVAGQPAKSLRARGVSQTLGMNPGQIVRAEKRGYQPGPAGSGQAEGVIKILQAGYRIIGNRWAFPEYASTADASNNNKSSGETAETPLIRSTERKQSRVSKAEVDAIWIALSIHCKQGRFKQFDITSAEQLKRFVRIQATPPSVGTKRISEEIARDQALVTLGGMSRQTLAERHGLDYDIEKERIREEDSERLDSGLEGLLGGGGGSGPLQEGCNHGRSWTDYPLNESTRQELDSIARGNITEADDCGANAPGGGGFQPGNTCAGDGGGGKATGEPNASGGGGKQTDTPEFKAWFGGSKVVDKDGKPLVVYHGTNYKSPIDEFFLGTHFGTSKAASDRVKDTGKSGSIYPAYLKIENPKIYDDDPFFYAKAESGEPKDIAEVFFAISLIDESAVDQVAKAQEVSIEAGKQELRRKLSDTGYDGIKYVNWFEDSGSDSYVAFEPNQIKSATGNRGTFNPSSDNINEGKQ